MNPLVFLGAALAGGLGASLRLLLDGIVRSRSRSDGMPWGTIVVNVSGSLLLGLLLGLATASVFSEEWVHILGVGLLGGYTTFSTASFETVRLLQQRRLGAALVNGLGVLAVTTLAAGLAYWAGASLAG